MKDLRSAKTDSPLTPINLSELRPHVRQKLKYRETRFSIFKRFKRTTQAPKNVIKQKLSVWNVYETFMAFQFQPKELNHIDQI